MMYHTHTHKHQKNLKETSSIISSSKAKSITNYHLNTMESTRNQVLEILQSLCSINDCQQSPGESLHPEYQFPHYICPTDLIGVFGTPNNTKNVKDLGKLWSLLEKLPSCSVSAVTRIQTAYQMFLTDNCNRIQRTSLFLHQHSV